MVGVCWGRQGERGLTRAPLPPIPRSTFGYWKETQPVAVQLVAGKNRLEFMRASEAVAPIAVKGVFVYLQAPDIPIPPSNYTPTPPAPRPDRFIEVPDVTTCVKQGLADVPLKFCEEACQALGFKYAGGKARVNMTSCFVLSDGVCSYNTNATATVCPQQPCTIDGSVAQQICLR